MAFTPLDEAMCQLFTVAFFFAMRYCEYLKVSGIHQIKLLTLKNIRLFKGRQELQHNDKHLKSADTVSFTFEYQKRILIIIL